MASKEYLTPEGFQKFQNELRNILNVERPKLVKVVSWAASNGDRSENGDYLYGKRKLREYDRRIRFLTKLLENAEVFAPPSGATGGSVQRVVFGAWVKCREADNVSWFRIVGSEEIGSDPRYISYKSPLARAILGKSIDDEVTVIVPKGERVLEIEEIKLSSPED